MRHVYEVWGTVHRSSSGRRCCVCPLLRPLQAVEPQSLLVFGAVGAYAILTVKMTLWQVRSARDEQVGQRVSRPP